ncbi:hypothetical protein [Hydrogenivirga sp. 128-5-R1-1]|uniref:hypothetical protein n=1 Tax=Hydrogenivirga sp. 128-5-R1-1 TaxID=392423 RepID=UPI00015F371B|nr:hypothetical protein [Hydrogenivirga sp. 128-5-R1-1]EDP76395.1 hypothetical protein HG1285_02273 [Hydrogenivirga sp. 128-5-R1-1]
MKLLFLLTLVVFSFAQPIKSFKYCGHIEVLGFEGNMPMPIPMMPMGIKGYVSPTGIDPQPPKTCTWVFLETRRGDLYVPTIVVWSDTYAGYHADIYSDPSYIFGYRQRQPSDFSPAGLEQRNREMENYLSNAAGSRVLLEVLKAIKSGRPETGFEALIEVPIATTLGVVPRVRVRYYLYDFEVNPVVPPNVQRLIEEGRSKRIPHTPLWEPVTVPADLVGG